MELVLWKRKDNVLWVSLNRVSVLNAINTRVLKELGSVLEEHAQDPSLRALVLCGEGGCFAAGADIAELTGLDEQGIRGFHGLREGVFSRLEAFAAPTVALIERYALGTGLELALCCDFRIAAADAKLGVPSAKLGLVESLEYLSRVVRAVGPFWAKKLVLTAENVDAATAFSIGLVEEVVPPEAVRERMASLLARISQNSVYSMRQSKKALNQCAADPYLLRAGDTALPLVESVRQEDFTEGTRAFLEKRAATFR